MALVRPLFSYGHCWHSGGVIVAFHGLHLLFEILQLFSESGIRIDDAAALPNQVEGCAQTQTMFIHQVSGNAGRAPRNTGPTMNVDSTS